MMEDGRLARPAERGRPASIVVVQRYILIHAQG